MTTDEEHIRNRYTSDVQYILEHLDDENSKVVFLELCEGYIGNDMYNYDEEQANG